MPWARLDDRINIDAKILALSDAAHRMWTSGLAYCQFNLTDGYIPQHAIHSFGVRAPNKGKVADELCSVLVPGKKALWSKVHGGYRVNDYLDWNDSKDKVVAERAKAKERLERHRNKGPFPRVVNGSIDATRNGVVDALQTADETPHGSGCERTSTYHVPQEDEQQEHAPDGARMRSLETLRVRMLRRQRSRETLDGAPALRVIAALARHILAGNPDLDEHELMERVKEGCARANLEYCGAVGPAIDRARAQLAKRQKVQASA